MKDKIFIHIPDKYKGKTGRINWANMVGEYFTITVNNENIKIKLDKTTRNRNKSYIFLYLSNGSRQVMITNTALCQLLKKQENNGYCISERLKCLYSDCIISIAKNGEQNPINFKYNKGDRIIHDDIDLTIVGRFELMSI